MANETGYQGHVIFRLGLSGEVAGALLGNGEPAYTLDDRVVWIGDETTTPGKIATTKSRGVFDFTSSTRWTLPGGIVFDTAKPGLIGGINLADFNTGNGFLARVGDGRFASVNFVSTSGTIKISSIGANGQVSFDVDPTSDLIGSTAKVIVSATPPENPREGQLWLDSDTNVLYIRRVEKANAFWVTPN